MAIVHVYGTRTIAKPLLILKQRITLDDELYYS